MDKIELIEKNMADDIALDLDDFIQVGVLNQKRFAEILVLAKGSGRSMRKYAEDCGINAVALSRFKNGKKVRPVAKNKLVKMAEEARPDDELLSKKYILAEFLLANGMASKKFTESGGIMRLRDGRKISEIKHVVFLSLLDHGLTLRYEKQLSKLGLGDCLYNFGDHEWSIVEIPELVPKYYCFHFLVNLSDDFEPRRPLIKNDVFKNLSDDIYCCLDQIGMVLLMDCWEPTKFKNMRNIFVFGDKEKYDQFVEFSSAHPTNSEMSAILVSMLYKRVISEFLFSMNDGGVVKPLFDAKE